MTLEQLQVASNGAFSLLPIFIICGLISFSSGVITSNSSMSEFRLLIIFPQFLIKGFRFGEFLNCSFVIPIAILFVPDIWAR